MNDSYMLGFCKTAAAAGLDPAFLVKVAKVLEAVKTIEGFNKPVFDEIIKKMPKLYTSIANSSVKLDRKAYSSINKAMRAYKNNPTIQRLGFGIKAGMLKKYLEQRGKSTLRWAEDFWGDVLRHGGGNGKHMREFSDAFNDSQHFTTGLLNKLPNTGDPWRQVGELAKQAPELGTGWFKRILEAV